GGARGAGGPGGTAELRARTADAIAGGRLGAHRDRARSTVIRGSHRDSARTGAPLTRKSLRFAAGSPRQREAAAFRLRYGSCALRRRRDGRNVGFPVLALPSAGRPMRTTLRSIAVLVVLAFLPNGASAQI